METTRDSCVVRSPDRARLSIVGPGCPIPDSTKSVANCVVRAQRFGTFRDAVVLSGSRERTWDQRSVDRVKLPERGKSSLPKADTAVIRGNRVIYPDVDWTGNQRLKVLEK